MKKTDYNFFLGGNDLEMQTIEQLLQQQVAPQQIFNKQLDWGAKASDYAEEIRESIKAGKTPVLIELENDITGFDDKLLLIVDHHQEKAGEQAPTALQQIWQTLGLSDKEWRQNREYQLIAANDSGHIAAMQAIDASVDEIRHIRARDRQAQGINNQQEQQAEQAISQRQRKLDGQLTVVDLPHGACATVTDRLHKAMGGEGYDNLLIFSPQEVNFYGNGQVVEALAEAYPQSWYGGELPKRGYWGLANDYEANTLLAQVEQIIQIKTNA